ncbi:MAG TPA: ABC transporter ATP-binding protein [Myxococcales bacterium]
MTASLREQLSWPGEDAHLALEALGRHSRLATRTAELLAPPPMPPGRFWRLAFDRWIQPAAAQLGAEAEPVEPIYGEVEALLRTAAPALLAAARGGNVRLYVLLGFRRGRARLLGPDHRVATASVADLSRELRYEEDVRVAPEIEALLAETPLEGARREKARAAMLAARCDGLRLRQCWLLKPSPGLSLRAHAVHARIPQAFFATLACHALQYLAVLGAWWVIGAAGLSGRFQPGWFAAWVLLLFCVVPLRLFELWWQGAFALRAGAQLKQRLLQGTLKLHPDEVRADGAGHHFGKTSESENVETLALGGGLLALLSTVDLVAAAVVLWRGAAGGPHVVALAAWLSLLVALGVRHYRRQRRWAASRIEVTHALLERMEGHRTRLAQEAPGRWHAGEDELLSEYHDVSARMDGSAAFIVALARRGFLLLGLLALGPAFVFGAPSATALALSVGGILLATRAFEDAAESFQQLSAAATSFEQIRPLLHAAGRSEPQGVEASLPAKDGAEHGKPLLEMRGLGFRYSPGRRPVLDRCDLQIRRGDRLLLEGASGSGKSTLAAVLAGLRAPSAGLLLLDGMDRATLGALRWQQRITFAPQFHDNHVFAGPFSLNLMLGREWPPIVADLAQGEEVCRELGLGPLLDRMPGGMGQMVGETGWQLSHGERSRLYIARTLMQEADLVVLDESFAALDPETLSLALRCVLRRADSLLVIAHP